MLKTKALLAMLLPLGVAAQTLSLSGPTLVKPGSSVGLALTLSGTTVATAPAALQWSIDVPAGITVSATPGAAAVTAGKTITCSSTPALNCIAAGMNANVFGDGVIAILTFSAPAAPLNLTLSKLLGASLAATPVTETAGPPFAIAVVSPCDLNGDGKTDMSDVTGSVLAANSIGTCTPQLDINADGICNVLDVQRIVNAAVPGGSCKVGK